MDVNNNDNTGIVQYANLFFDFLTLNEPFNERELEAELSGIQQEESGDE
jgi:hypothetical protein